MFEAPIADCRSCPLGVASSPRCPFVPSLVPPDAVIYSQGDIPPGVYFVRQGLLVLRSVDVHGQETSLTLRGARSVVGFEALSGVPSPYELRTVTSARLCALPPDAAQAWLNAGTSHAKAMVDLLLGELNQRHSDWDRQSGSSLERVARFLLENADVEWKEQAIPKQMLARMLGLRPETLSRCLTQLAQRQLIARRPALRVLNRAGLSEVAVGSSPQAAAG